MSQAFEKTVKDIKSLKIQGAQNIAVEATKALRYILNDKKNKKSPASILDALYAAKKKLFLARPTEPALRNSLNYALAGIDIYQDTALIEKVVEKRTAEALEHFVQSREKIQEFGESKIKNNMTVYTHCHSSTVTGILINAWKKGKRFTVNNTETRPLYQGRKTAAELAKQGIPVNHYVDSAARQALKNADIMLIGADAVTADGKVVNKIGSELIAIAAQKLHIPVYACTDSWKYDPETAHAEEPIEERDTHEVWSGAPRRVKVHNPAFERMHPKLVTGIISELGVHKPKEFVNLVQKKNRWL